MDLAPYVRADLAVMKRDSLRMRGDLPFVFTNLLSGEGLDTVTAWIKQRMPQRVPRA
jgi:urease accessory protein